jgi:hypothetical protein
MQELIQALKEVEAATDLVNRSMYNGVWWLTNGTEDEMDPRVAKAAELASGYLIDSKGNADFRAIATLKGSGFNVTKGESDSFGWLTGIIHTKQGRIVYG